MTRAQLERLFARALGELDLAKRVAVALRATEPRTATRRFTPPVPARIIAIGKAAPAMAAGAIAHLGGAVERCLVVAPDGTDTTVVAGAAKRAGVADETIVIHRAAHPLPDARSVRAGRACLATAHTTEKRRIVVLVSGGASALACAPAPGVTLRTKRAITRAMLASGASIQELNVVRKHLSRLKGGGLARAAAPNPVLTIIASDVIGGTPGDVGSGPSVAEALPVPVREARRLLRRYAPAYADVPLVRSVRSAHTVTPRVVASPEELARIYARLLREHGIAARVLPPSQAGAEELAAEYVALSRSGKHAGAAKAGARTGAKAGAARVFVRAAEPSVTLPQRGAGRGGRCSHLAALVARGIGGRARVVFAALATDGVDGASGTGGAIIDGTFAARVAERLGPDALDRALRRFDTGALQREMEAAVPARPTGHNLTDLHVLVVG